MIIAFAPLPAHLVNRDLKRDLRYICPGYTEDVRGIPVARLTGKRSHLYTIGGYQMDLECVVSVLTGWTPMPYVAPPPVAYVQLGLFDGLEAA